MVDGDGADAVWCVDHTGYDSDSRAIAGHGLSGRSASAGPERLIAHFALWTMIELRCVR